MSADPAVDRTLRSVAATMPVDRDTLAGLLRDRPGPHSLVPLLTSSKAEVVRATIVYVGLYGSMSDTPMLALYLHHEDGGVADLAEQALWSVWLQAGSPAGNRALAAAIRLMDVGDMAGAIDSLHSLTDDEPGFAEAFFQLGVALSCSDRPTDASHAYRSALRLNQFHFAAAAALGHMCVELRNWAGALRCYRRALEIHPRLQGLAEAVLRLENRLGPRI